jgi:DNA-binding protein H-NS
MTTKLYRELLAERAALEVQIEQVKNVEREAAITQIQELMVLYQISTNELSKKRGPKTGAAVPPKYRDPDSGVTWSGRGKPPRWIAGKDRAAFEV